MSKVMALVFVLAALLGAAGCQTSYPPTPTPYIGNIGNVASPTPLPTPTTTDQVQYRVTGSAASAIVRFSNSQDGLSQVNTSLPYFVEFRSTQPSVFLSLDVTPITTNYAAYPYLNAQIFVNGVLFREASSTSASNTLSVSGTWRR